MDIDLQMNENGVYCQDFIDEKDRACRIKQVDLGSYSMDDLFSGSVNYFWGETKLGCISLLEEKNPEITEMILDRIANHFEWKWNEHTLRDDEGRGYITLSIKALDECGKEIQIDTPLHAISNGNSDLDKLELIKLGVAQSKDKFGSYFEFCNSNEIDISDIVNCKIMSSSVDRNSYIVAYQDMLSTPTLFAEDKEYRNSLFEDTCDCIQAYLDNDVYFVGEYDYESEEFIDQDDEWVYGSFNLKNYIDEHYPNSIEKTVDQNEL